MADVTVTGSLDARGGTYDAMDAVLDATGGQVPELPEHVPYFPLLLGGRVTLVGPALTGAGRARTWAAFRDRALAWADAEDVTPAPRPVADALAGALAGQLIFDTLTGTAAMGEAHVVHGADLVSDRVTVEELMWRPRPADRAPSRTPWRSRCRKGRRRSKRRARSPAAGRG